MSDLPSLLTFAPAGPHIAAMDYRPPAWRSTDGDGILSTDKETQKLFTVLCNYLSLGQFELARSVIDELFLISPERVCAWSDCICSKLALVHHNEMASCYFRLSPTDIIMHCFLVAGGARTAWHGPRGHSRTMV